MLNNLFIHKVLKLLFKLIKLNIFSILEQENKLFILVPLLVQILEYNIDNLEMSEGLRASRVDRYDKKQSKKNEKTSLIGGLCGCCKGIVGSLGDVYNIANKFVDEDEEEDGGVVSGKSKKEKENFDDAVFYNNPIMRGLIPFRSFIQQIFSQDEAASASRDDDTAHQSFKKKIEN